METTKVCTINDTEDPCAQDNDQITNIPEEETIEVARDQEEQSRPLYSSLLAHGLVIAILLGISVSLYVYIAYLKKDNEHLEMAAYIEREIETLHKNITLMSEEKKSLNLIHEKNMRLLEMQEKKIESLLEINKQIRETGDIALTSLKRAEVTLEELAERNHTHEARDQAKIVILTDERRKIESHRQNTSMKLEENTKLIATAHQRVTIISASNKNLRAVLRTKKVSFIETFCNMTTLECTKCPAGWLEYASRCFFVSQHNTTWANARRECMDLGADLAVIQNEQDQEFLTNLIVTFYQNLTLNDKVALWIGLDDLVKEAKYNWVDGRDLSPALTYWKPGQSNNFVASWDTFNKGEDCVAITLPDKNMQGSQLNNWDDIACVLENHSICEMAIFVIP